MQLFSLEGRTAVVTGALGKLGPMWLEGLLDAGARVIGVDLPGTEPTENFLRLSQKFDGSRISIHRADVTDRAALESLVDAIVAERGAPHILVNNAGIDQPPAAATSYRVQDVPLDVMRQVLDVNVLGSFLTMQVVGASMIDAGRGCIVNIGSLYASVSPDARFYEHIDIDPPFLKPPAYGASKAALINLTRYFATHWGPLGLRVNALSPGGVLGNQDEEFKRKFCARVPLKRMAEKSDLIGPLLFLASDAAAYVNGAEVVVDGGFLAW